MAAATLDPLKDAIHREYSALPEGDTLIERLLTKFENVYDKPPRDELSKILGREFDNDDDIREILFKPAPHHGRCYSRLLNSEDFPSARTLALGLLFLLQRFDWPVLVDFVEEDGLDAISKLLSSSNLYERSQAVEILLTILFSENIDWFQVYSGSSHEEKMQAKLFAASANLLRELAANRENSYPGGSFRCLQLIGFLLSWLSAKHPSVLQEVVLRDDVERWMGKENCPQEVQLAKVMWEEFFSTARSEPTGLSTTNSDVDRLSLVNKLKTNGNNHFRKGEHKEALEAYTLALNACGPHLHSKEFAEIIIVLRTNIANTLWKRFKQSRSPSDLSEIEAQCTAALQLDLPSLKAVYRLACCRLAAGRIEDASRTLETIKSVIDSNSIQLKAAQQLAIQRLASLVRGAQLQRSTHRAPSPIFDRVYGDLCHRYGLKPTSMSDCDPRSEAKSRHKKNKDRPSPQIDSDLEHHPEEPQSNEAITKNYRKLVRLSMDLIQILRKSATTRGASPHEASPLPELLSKIDPQGIDQIVKSMKRMDQKQRMSEALAASAAVPDSFVLLLLWAVVALDFRDEVQSVLMVYLIHEKHVASAVFRLSMEFDFLLPSLRRAIQMRDKSSATEAVDKLLSRLSLG